MRRNKEAAQVTPWLRGREGLKRGCESGVLDEMQSGAGSQGSERAKSSRIFIGRHLELSPKQVPASLPNSRFGCALADAQAPLLAPPPKKNDIKIQPGSKRFLFPFSLLIIFCIPSPNKSLSKLTHGDVGLSLSLDPMDLIVLREKVPGQNPFRGECGNAPP